MKGDNNHLHHRLLDIGYSWKNVVFIEVAMMVALCTIAFYLSGFSDQTIGLMILFTVLIALFILIS